MADAVAGGGLRGAGWVVAALALAIGPHLPHLPPWVPLLVLAAAGWRWTAAERRWPLPPRWLRALVVVAATVAIAASFGTLNGIEAGTALLVLMAGVKLLETRGARDLSVLVLIVYFLLFAALLRDQSLPQLPLLVGIAFLATTALMSVHAGSVGESTRELLRRTGALVVQAAPLAILLFLLFPRVPGPFWGLAAPTGGRTGLDDQMTPGDVSELSVSGEVAFRARFAGPLPPPVQRYWRGPVLSEFDGRSWRRSQLLSTRRATVTYRGAPVDYRITLEPHDRRWVLALDLPAAWPDARAALGEDLVLLASRPLSRVASFELRSHPGYVADAALPEAARAKFTRLPGKGNPRAVALGRELAGRHGTPAGIVSAGLDWLRERDFVYTLTPPGLADDPVDEFLFETRAGFCEHYASAFAVLMRAAGLPARVVTGYQGGEFNPLGRYLIVRQSDAHAWNEVWLEGRGWVRVDPTAAVAPERIESGLSSAVAAGEPVPGRLLQGSELLLRLRLAWDRVNDEWNERVVRFDAERQLRLLDRLGAEDADWRTLGLWLAAAVALFFVGLSLYLALRHRAPLPDWPARLHADVMRQLARRGVVRGPAEGPVAYLDRAARTLPHAATALHEIRRLYVALRYGPSPSAADLRRLKHLVNRLRA